MELFSWWYPWCLLINIYCTCDCKVDVCPLVFVTGTDLNCSSSHLKRYHLPIMTSVKLFHSTVKYSFLLYIFGLLGSSCSLRLESQMTSDIHAILQLLQRQITAGPPAYSTVTSSPPLQVGSVTSQCFHRYSMHFEGPVCQMFQEAAWQCVSY